MPVTGNNVGIRLLGKLSFAHSDVYYISMQRGKLIGRLSKYGELPEEQGSLHASSWMHSMHPLQPSKDLKISRMPSHPGAQADNSPGAQCCSALNHDPTDTAQACIPVTSTCQQHRAGLPGPASSSGGAWGTGLCVWDNSPRSTTRATAGEQTHPAQVATVLRLDARPLLVGSP